jgi:2-polyprenyl-3-methyl-5-hydroxy-6-metoxy-1,4-benzoquinol methylase
MMSEQSPAERSLRDEHPTTTPERRAHDLEEYTRRLHAERAWWKRLLNTQAPYAWNVRRLVRGRTLDVGCGVGRNLLHLDGNGVGVDTNVHSVAVARQRGLVAYTTEEFSASADALHEGYSTVLIAHVLEHMREDEACTVVGAYLPYLESGGRVVVIVPQEAGFRSDPTHVQPVGSAELARIAQSNGLRLERVTSFPLPRLAGKVFRHNETVAVMQKPI